MLQLFRKLESHGYHSLRETPIGVVGLYPFIFTHAIVCEITEHSYEYRFCYGSLLEAECALEDWAKKNYAGEPEGFIKRKGVPYQEEAQS